MQQLNQEPEPLRVSSREFVEAIADIEARANSRQADEMVSVEEALASIGMEIPPEEVIAVIKARRAAAMQRSTEKQVRKRASVGRAFAALLCVSMFANIVMIAVVSRHQATEYPASVTQPVGNEIVQSLPAPTAPAVIQEVPPAVSSATEMEDGMVHIVPRKSGVVRFARGFAHPPNVEITGLGPSKTRIVEITREGFTWECSDADNSANLGDYRWTASGTR